MYQTEITQYNLNNEIQFKCRGIEQFLENYTANYITW